MKNGLYKSYYDNDQLRVECNYTVDLQANQLDKLNGLYKSYRTTGQLWAECNYTVDLEANQLGKRNGLLKTYYINGQLEYLSYDINNVEYYLRYTENKFAIMI